MSGQPYGLGGTDGEVAFRSGGKGGFYGIATPVVQPATLTAPAATAATNSSPYGFSQAQADAIITWIRAMDVIVKANGFTAAS